VNVVLEKKHDARIGFKHEGTVNVPCDLTSEDFDLPIQGNEIVSSVLETHITMMRNDCWFFQFELDIAQYIYEMIALSVPLRQVHPGVQDGV
jgi:uncharacterized metal-binding protein YceD (DUF177 family)